MTTGHSADPLIAKVSKYDFTETAGVLLRSAEEAAAAAKKFVGEWEAARAKLYSKPTTSA